MVFKFGRQIVVSLVITLITILATCTVNSLVQYLTTHDNVLLVVSCSSFIALLVTIVSAPGIFLYFAIKDEISRLRRYLHNIEKYLRQSSTDPPLEKKPIHVKTRCINVQIINIEEVNDVLEIYVKCRLGYMTENGCPTHCPGYRTMLEDKLSKILNNIIRIGYYTAIIASGLYILKLTLDTAYTITKLTGKISTWLVMIDLTLKSMKIGIWTPYLILIGYSIAIAAMYIYDRRLRKYAPLREILRKARKKRKKVVIYLSN